MDWETANDYIYAKSDGSQHRSGGEFRHGAMKAFLDEKKLKPGLDTYKKDDGKSAAKSSKKAAGAKKAKKK